MKVLFLSPWNPYPPVFGARLRVLSLLRALVAGGRREVDLLAFSEPGDDLEQSRRRLGEIGVRAHFVPHHAAKSSRSAELPARAAAVLRGVPFNAQLFRHPALSRALRALLRENRYQLLFAETSWMGQHVAGDSAPKLLSWQNVDFEVYQRRAASDGNPIVRALRLYNYRVARRFELALVPRFDALLTVTEADRRSLLAHGTPRTPVHVVPICVDTSGLAEAASAARRTPGQLLFVGAMFYEPNVDAVRYFHDEIYGRIRARHPAARLVIVGRDPTEAVRRLAREDGSVVVTGTVDDVTRYYGESSIFVAPIRYGGGMKTKIVEAMAAELPVVATPFALEGIAARDGVEVLQADDPASFADRVLELLQDGERRERLAGAGRALVERSYSWDALGVLLDRVVEGCASPR